MKLIEHRSESESRVDVWDRMGVSVPVVESHDCWVTGRCPASGETVTWRMVSPGKKSEFKM